ncbi:MAG: ATP phosphoribosyltransferase regulatory subunit [Clostridia bacterium]|nr:ATP phosphoribosyltransferase regulatory subunit [Clostridia bacterium]
MQISSAVLKKDEKAIFGLRELYQKYGYSQFKMSKFEPYDLYVRNKDFLISENVITFTDAGGRLMALKPDVTLSIIKNTPDAPEFVQKVYYNENVYRTGADGTYKEIMQLGLECIGQVDAYCISEVLMLAAESLAFISEDFVLDISHMGIVSPLLDEAGASPAARTEILKCIGEKNAHGVAAACAAEGLDSTKLCALVTTYGAAADVLPKLDVIRTEGNAAAMDELSLVLKTLEKCGFGDRIRIDFSVICDMNYYNGFVFRGFIQGLAAGILSGGQYDTLMARMGKKAGAIGFALYLDMLEQLSPETPDYDVDTVLLYDEGADMRALTETIGLLTANGKRVMAQRSVPEKIRYRQLLKLQERGVEILENNA